MLQIATASNPFLRRNRADFRSKRRLFGQQKGAFHEKNVTSDACNSFFLPIFATSSLSLGKRFDLSSEAPFSRESITFPIAGREAWNDDAKNFSRSGSHTIYNRKKATSRADAWTQRTENPYARAPLVSTGHVLLDARAKWLALAASEAYVDEDQHSPNEPTSAKTPVSRWR